MCARDWLVCRSAHSGHTYSQDPRLVTVRITYHCPVGPGHVEPGSAEPAKRSHLFLQPYVIGWPRSWKLTQRRVNSQPVYICSYWIRHDICLSLSQTLGSWFLLFGGTKPVFAKLSQYDKDIRGLPWCLPRSMGMGEQGLVFDPFFAVPSCARST